MVRKESHGRKNYIAVLTVMDRIDLKEDLNLTQTVIFVGGGKPFESCTFIFRLFFIYLSSSYLLSSIEI